jgi:lipopolysaccharide assembly outer membrane protein LptD (OstA)
VKPAGGWAGALALAGVLAWTLAVTATPGRAQAREQEPLNIAADNVSGSHGPSGDVVLLNGNVRITRGTTVLTAETGRYMRAQGLLDLDGRVKMVDTTTTVTCDHASYSELDDILNLSGNVKVVDRDAELRAPSGTYDRRTGRADLYGGVEGRQKQQRLVADRAVYLRDSSVVQAFGNVRGTDDENRLELKANRVDWHRDTDEAVATGDPVLESKDADGRVTELRALTLRVNTTSRIAEAIDSVHVVRDTLQARSDYALFDDQAERGFLLGSPRAWDDQTTVTGDTLEIWSKARVVDRFVVRGNAVMDYRGNRPGAEGETSRLTGRRVDVFFRRQEIDSLVATGAARNEYGAVPRAGQTSERNMAEGDTITVYFRQRKIDRARVEGGAKGQYHLAVAAEDTAGARREFVRYDATRIVYDVPKAVITLDDRAHLEYRDLELRARKVEFDVDDQTLVANGNPQLVDRGDKVTGHLMTYDLETRVGTIYQAETAYEKGLYHGSKIRKVGDNELDVLDGQYSTCDLEQPHYHFAAHYMKIFLKDKLVAKPVIFYVRNVPLLALPFWVFPVKPGRHSGFLFPQFELGFNNQAGQFIRNAGYYWAPNDYFDVTVGGDYYQADPSYVLRAETVYRLLYLFDGQARGTFAKSEADGSENWDFYGTHAQELTARTRFTAQGQFTSSRSYHSSNQYGHSLSQRLNRFLNSSLSVSHTADWASVNLYMDRVQDLDADVALEDPDGEGPLSGPPIGTEASLANLTESTPNLSVAFPTRTVGSLALLRESTVGKALQSLYVSLNARFLSQRTRRAFVTSRRDVVIDSVTTRQVNVLDQRVSTRRAFATGTTLTDSRRALGWINLQPRFSGNLLVFDFDELGHRVVPTGTWSSGVNASATFYGTFLPRMGALEGIRHVVFPSVSYNYSPEFPHLIYRDSLGIPRERFRGFGGISVSGFQQSLLRFGVDQRLQVKLRRGDDVQRLDNLLSWSVAGSYNFLWREQNQEHPLSLLSSSVFLQPPGFVNGSMSWSTDVYAARPIRSLGYNVGMSLSSRGGDERLVGSRSTPDLPTSPVAPADEFRDQWSLGLAYSYAGGRSTDDHWTSAQTANAVLRYQLTPSWSLDYATSLNVTLRNLETQRFSLTRDLHCWTATFTRTFISGGEAEYYFRLGIKEQKEVYVERGTRVGSLGGIQ